MNTTNSSKLACPACGEPIAFDLVEWDSAEGTPADFGRCPLCGTTSEADDWKEAEPAAEPTAPPTRRGRPPLNGQAMTWAERKKAQRERDAALRSITIEQIHDALGTAQRSLKNTEGHTMADTIKLKAARTELAKLQQEIETLLSLIK